jgi:hypothetical protein
MEWKRILQVYARIFFEDATFRQSPHCLYQALKVPNDFKDFNVPHINNNLFFIA